MHGEFSEKKHFLTSLFIFCSLGPYVIHWRRTGYTTGCYPFLSRDYLVNIYYVVSNAIKYPGIGTIVPGDNCTHALLESQRFVRGGQDISLLNPLFHGGPPQIVKYDLPRLYLPITIGRSKRSPDELDTTSGLFKGRRELLKRDLYRVPAVRLIFRTRRNVCNHDSLGQPQTTLYIFIY